MRNKTLVKLLADNRGMPRAFKVKATADEATVYLYDVIVSDELTAEYWGGVAPESFARELATITAPTIHLRINSPGGDVFAARAMQAAIREHPATVIAHVDGYAASAASVVAMAADEIRIADGGMIMVHNSWTIAYGNADDLLAMAALLEKIDGTLVTDYANKSGKPTDTVRQWMADETWFTGQEAIDAGLADGLDGGADPKAQAAWDLSVYDHAPQRAAPEPGLEAVRAKLDAAADKMLAAAEKLAPKAADPIADTDHLGRVLRLKLAAVN